MKMFIGAETQAWPIRMATILTAVLAFILFDAGSIQAQWTTDASNNIYYNGGKVAIGQTPSGNFQFEVAGYGQTGTGAKIGVMTIARSGGDYDSIGYNFRPTSTSGLYKYNLGDTSSRIEFTAGGFKFKTAPSGTSGNDITYTDVMTILQGGNVGLGIAPTTRFHIKLGSTYDALTIEESQYGRQFRIVAPSATTGATLFRNTFTGADFVWERNPAGDGSTFLEDMRLSGGKLGIGNYMPLYKLDVLGSDSVQARFGNAADNGLFLMGLNSSGYVNAGASFNGSNWIAKNSTAATIFEQHGGAFNFYSNSSGLSSGGSFSPTQIVKFAPNGNVGIGTTAPAAKLHIYNVGGTGAGLSINGNDPVNANLTLVNTNGNTFTLTAGIPQVTNSNFSISQGSTSHLVIANVSGNVGIGKPDPAERLEVNGNLKLSGSGNLTAAGSIDAAGGLKINGSPVTSSQWSNGSGSINYATGNVGIGTTTPSQKLDVRGNGQFYAPNVNFMVQDSGTGYAAATLQSQNGSGGIVDIGAEGATAGGNLSGTSANDGFMMTRNNHNLHLGTNGASRFVINTSGNVGIGTTAPAAKLHIYNVGGSSAGLSINGNDPANANLSLVNTNGNTFTLTAGIPQVTNSNFSISQGNTPHLVIANVSGNVGIGLPDPGSYRLNVNGTINASELRLNGATIANWASSGSDFYSTGSVGIGSAPGSNYKFQVHGVGAGAGAKFGGALNIARSAGDYDSIGYNFRGTNNGGTYKYDLNDTSSRLEFYQGGFKFKTAPSGTGGDDINYADALTIRESGNVGIGTPSPARNFVVAAAGQATLQATDTNLGVGASNGFQIQQAGANTNLLNYENGYISLFTNVTERMRILAGGNVGIGKPDPAERLEVNGNLKLSGTGNLTALGSIDAAGGLKINGSPVTSSQWSTGSGNINYTSGNVGIGTTAPAAKLHIYNVGASDAAISINGNDPANASLTLVNTNGNTFTLTAGIPQVTNSNFSISQGSTSHLVIANGSGKVGIGLNDPGSYKLNVNGSTNVTGNLNITAGADGPGNIVAAGTIFAKYQDVAEWVPSSEQLAAGTVVVLDSTKSNQVTSSSVSYDTRVAGVVSEQPGIALGEKSDSKVLVATTGRVKVKVDASKGPIHIGDLLVTSDVPGVAMKSEAVNLGGVQFHRPGTLIGKALEPLEKGKGEILVLLSLQ
jgi:hypothetical protein